MHTSGFSMRKGRRMHGQPWMSHEEEADALIRERGLLADRDELVERLTHAGYERLSSYWHIFRVDGTKGWRFAPGTALDAIWDLYVFDRQLRLVTLDAIERVEVYFRAALGYELSRLTGEFGYLEPARLPRLGSGPHRDFVNRCRREYARSRDAIALGYRSGHGEERLPPYGVMVNLMGFGMTLTLFEGADPSVRGHISGEFSVAPTVMESWLRTLNTVRNISAHHGRLWNRELGTKPMIPKGTSATEWHAPYEVRPNRVFAALTILSSMLEIVAPSTGWRARLLPLILGRSEDERERMGFGRGWEACPLWSRWLA